ncbi:type III secretion integral inner membrane protein [Waddlia chondrophila 2032/99]|uniref:Type III secretion inner membrane protein SctR n=2 Tax=Waddlia chondrophila TaxID=71667 RepID=D6YTK7_WADCW|nr:type III secretion system export apparatus subunit SctR [Waddlia chondrophila]ADI37468.1 type III secretion inner membrane protein SctR [Waddlia chondrophila WSU 86-1044]CCB90784.1 type III secretion integral inner membrane protein [Waddlia chondrophila 2032/99]
MKKKLLFSLKLFVIIGILWISPNQLILQKIHAAESYENLIAQSPPRTTTSPQQAAPPQQQSIQANILDNYEDFKKPSLITQAAVLTILSMLPFIVMILTSFMKIVIVLSLLRNALGVQQAPPNQIINGVGLMLSMFIMYPTVVEMYEVSQKATQEMQAPDSVISSGSSTYILTIADATKEPLRTFLIDNSSVRHRALFFRMAYKVLPEKYRPNLKPEDFIIVVPSFITSQLKDAFEIGVLIYIPFFVIDLVTSNILLAMGMMMLSPVTISMPLKLFLLVMLDGWTLLVEGLVNTFR